MQPIRQTADTWEGSVVTKAFSLRRLIRLSGHRIEVQDTLTNLSDMDLGWMIRNELALPSEATRSQNIHLGGDSRTNPSPVYATVIKAGGRIGGIDCWRPANPTVYVPFSDCGLGMVIEDDVMRVHGLSYYRTTNKGDLIVGFRDEQFALAPGCQYTTRWAAYVIPGPNKDYYDFINQVRADWKVNDIRIPGPTIWSTYFTTNRKMPDEEIQKRLRRSGAWAIATSLGGWVCDYEGLDDTKGADKRQVGFGAGVLDPCFARLRELWAQDAKRVHQLAPAIKVLHYFHLFLNDPERDPSAFQDSRITRSDGRNMIAGWGNLRLTPSNGVFPTLTNTMGREMLKVFDMMRSQMGGDGIYLDEVNYPTGIGWMGSPPFTYSQWDGHSAVLDPVTFAIARKTGYLQLLSADYKKMLFDLIATRGGVIVGNGEPDTAWENALKFPRHTECRTDPYPRAYESHLYTPICLVEDTSMSHRRNLLKYGVIDCFVLRSDKSFKQEAVIRKSFPLTVQEIHSGWIKGAERIITMLPGSYTWGESARATILEFGSDGSLVGSRDVASPTGFFDVAIPPDGMTIIERTTTP